MSVIAELSIFPLDKGDSVSEYVARAVAAIDKSGLAYVFGPMSTAIEGEWDEVLNLVTECKNLLEPDCGRIIVHLRLDLRAGASGRLQSKVQSVQEKLPGAASGAAE